jgi:DNA-binding response OmpR family regulator
MSLVLVADTIQGSVTLKRILKGHELVVVHTMEAASASLQRHHFDLLVVGLQFDDSQMFELIREAKKSSKNFTKPIICFCSRDTEMARLMHESLELTIRTLGAWMYLSEHTYNVYQNPDAELRRIMDRCLTEESRKEIHQERLDIQKQRTEIQQLRNMLEAQEWSPELNDYLTGLRHDVELLLDRVTRLQSTAETGRASVESSRDLKDRVSEQVTSSENSMTQREEIQRLEETRQGAKEIELRGKEEFKHAEGQREQTDSSTKAK